MTEKEMILEMIQMQRGLDKAITDKKGLVWNKSKWNDENLRLAIIDEIGELNHELKAEWCWWKESQKEVDRKKVLEELVDVWHFVMMGLYQWCDTMEKFGISEEEVVESAVQMPAEISTIVNGALNALLFATTTDGYLIVFLKLLNLTKSLDFTIEDVYAAYKTKNQENYNRLQRGY